MEWVIPGNLVSHGNLRSARIVLGNIRPLPKNVAED